MNEDFVSFELAKKLKDKGFRWDCFAYYMPHSDELIYNVKPYKGVTLYSFNSLRKELISSDFIDAPTISQVLKWLREEKKIFIQMGLVEYKWEYMCFDINTIADNFYGWHKAMLKGDKVRFFDSYEQAALAGIEYVLDNLI